MSSTILRLAACAGLLLPPIALADPENVALNKPAAASSEYVGHPASLAVDGDPLTQWNAGEYGNPMCPDWVTVDLQAVYAVESISVLGQSHPGTAFVGRTNQYELLGSLDQIEWTILAMGVLVDTLDPADTHAIDFVPARYVRYSVVGGSHPSHQFELTVISSNPPFCAADFNNDRHVDPDDLSDFVTCFFTDPPCGRADFNADTSIDPDDLSDFITAFFGPPC